MAVSEHDKEHMRKLGEWKRQLREQDLREHLALSIDERLLRSFRRTEASGPYPRKEPEDFMQFYEWAKRMGKHRDYPPEKQADDPT